MTISDTQSASDRKQYALNICTVEPGKSPVDHVGGVGGRPFSYEEFKNRTVGVRVSTLSSVGETVTVTLLGPGKTVLEKVSVDVGPNEAVYLMFGHKYTPSQFPRSTFEGWAADGGDPYDQRGSIVYFN
ncbi:MULTISPECIES: hypothetical protein [Pseudomonas]|uniref:Uncharacterized protein n=1 Tax=Pseudomonas serboccidentalis TaxID=2964670 RepID=A0ABY7Z565_9PSED|nr:MULTISPECIES: hypothetical protein [Pseudomonas]MBT9265807.1 hypothetical protein [Pseudomonas sp. MG-9]WDR34725.1 hypothetical protein NN484_19740 [Pseudomonas serboccidentalis]